MPQLRIKPLLHGNIYVIEKVVDEKRRACVVKGTIVVAGPQEKAPP
jgi:hypothetical protein